VRGASDPCSSKKTKKKSEKLNKKIEAETDIQNKLLYINGSLKIPPFDRDRFVGKDKKISKKLFANYLLDRMDSIIDEFKKEYTRRDEEGQGINVKDKDGNVIKELKITEEKWNVIKIQCKKYFANKKNDQDKKYKYHTRDIEAFIR